MAKLTRSGKLKKRGLKKTTPPLPSKVLCDVWEEYELTPETKAFYTFISLVSEGVDILEIFNKVKLIRCTDTFENNYLFTLDIEAIGTKKERTHYPFSDRELIRYNKEIRTYAKSLIYNIFFKNGTLAEQEKEFSCLDSPTLHPLSIHNY